MTDERRVSVVSRREALQGVGIGATALIGSQTLTDTVMAQSGGPTNEISGTVEDSSGPVQGATVVAVPHDTSLAALLTTTDVDGNYMFSESDLHDGENLYHVIARDGSEASPRRGVPNYPFIAAEGPAAIPDSVVYQYPAENFDSSWTDQVGSADMSVNGMVSSTFSNGEDSVFGDGTDDYGIASGPETLPQNEAFGVAMTVEYAVGITDLANFTGYFDGTTSFQIRETADTPDGGVELAVLDSSGNELRVKTDNSYSGNPRAIIINKTSNSNVNFYVDSMSSPVASTVAADQGFDHSNFTPGVNMGFYARNESGGQNLYSECDVGVFEFNSEPYSQSDREGFVSRRPEV